MLGTSKQSAAAQARVILVVKLLAAGLSWLVFWSLAQSLSPTDFGLIAFSINLAGFLAVVGAFGQHMQLLRGLPSASRVGAVRQIRRAAILTASGSGIGLTVVAGANGFWALGAFGRLNLALLLPVIAFSMAFAVAEFLAQLARGLGDQLLALWPRELGWRLSLLIVLPALLAFAVPQPATVLYTMAALLGLWVMAQAIVIRARIRSLPLASSGQTEPGRSVDFWVSSVAGHALSNVDTLIVGLMLGPQVAGPYFIANRIAALLAFFLNAENMAVTPQIARLWSLGQVKDLADMCQKSARRAATATGVAACAFLIGGDLVLSAFGPDYVAATAPLRWLILAVLVNAITGPADIALNMTRHEGTARRVAALSLLVGLPAMCAGAFSLGAQGVACAVFATTVFRKGVVWATARRLLSIRCDAFVRPGQVLGAEWQKQ